MLYCLLVVIQQHCNFFQAVCKKLWQDIHVPCWKSVRPQPLISKASPVKTMLRSSTTSDTQPSVCPGVSNTVRNYRGKHFKLFTLYMCVILRLTVCMKWGTCSSYVFPKADLVILRQEDICRRPAEFGDGALQPQQLCLHQPCAGDVVSMAVGIDCHKENKKGLVEIMLPKIHQYSHKRKKQLFLKSCHLIISYLSLMFTIMDSVF